MSERERGREVGHERGKRERERERGRGGGMKTGDMKIHSMSTLLFMIPPPKQVVLMCLTQGFVFASMLVLRYHFLFIPFPSPIHKCKHNIKDDDDEDSNDRCVCVFVCLCCISAAGFCPHKSMVVGPITTQPVLPSVERICHHSHCERIMLQYHTIYAIWLPLG